MGFFPCRRYGLFEREVVVWCVVNRDFFVWRDFCWNVVETINSDSSEWGLQNLLFKWNTCMCWYLTEDGGAAIGASVLLLLILFVSGIRQKCRSKSGDGMHGILCHCIIARNPNLLPSPRWLFCLSSKGFDNPTNRWGRLVIRSSVPSEIGPACESQRLP